MTLEFTRSELFTSVTKNFRRDQTVVPKEWSPAIVPAWVGRIQNYCLKDIINRQELSLLGEDENLAFSSKMADGLNLMSNSIVLANHQDTEQFEAFCMSLRCFWPGSALEIDLNRSSHISINMFTKSLNDLAAKGVDLRPFERWFAAIGAMAVDGDQILFRKIIAPSTLGKPIGKMGVAKADEVSDRTAAEDTFYGHKENQDVLNTVRNFSQAVATQLRSLHPSMPLIKVAESAEQLAREIELLGDDEYKPTSIMRPMPSERLTIPLATAIASHFAENKVDDSREAVCDLAERFLRGVSRKRMAWDKDSVFSLLSTISNPDDLEVESYESETSGLGRELMRLGRGKCLELIKQLGCRNQSQVISLITDKVKPEIVYKIRQNGLHLFDWTEADYQVLGLPKQTWFNHNRRLKDFEELTAYIQQKGSWNVNPGDLVEEYFGEFNPATRSHRSVCEDVSLLSRLDFIRSGIVGREFKGQASLWVNINTGNRNKRSLLPEIRREIFLRSLKGLEDVQVWEADENAGLPTPRKLSRHRAYFEEFLDIPIENMIRVCGTDKLSPYGWYDEEREPEGYDILNNDYPHIWVIQREEMVDIETLFERIKQIQTNYKDRCIIMIPPYLDLHASDFRENAVNMPPFVLSTAVNPSVVARIKEVLDPNNRHLYYSDNSGMHEAK